MSKHFYAPSQNHKVHKNIHERATKKRWFEAPQGGGILNDIFRESGDEGQFQVQVEALYGF